MKSLNDDEKLFKTSSMDSLEGTEQRKIIDLIDKLRRVGLSSVLQLPQLVVCGDQSSGKSSVLEAITEIPFPRKENLCTRFATEIVLRRQSTSAVSTKITPDKNRPAAEQAKLRLFSGSIEGFDQLPDLIDEATTFMGLNDDSADTKAFSRDVLSIEISGPGLPQLTLVDLPGLIHAKNKVQTEYDIQLVKSLVEEYISSPRTIILSVISAKNDYANQIILEHCRRFDPEGARTLGIITKPDFLRPGSENEKTWMDLAQNHDIYLKLGWHMLRNRGDDNTSATFQGRNEIEAAFFSNGRYQELPRHTVGIEALRQRLSRTLQSHLRRELPGLKQDLDSMLAETNQTLSGLGEKRSTIFEQKMYLMEKSVLAHDLIKSAVRGNYEHYFFGAIDATAAVESETNICRLRAVVQHGNLGFARDMRLFGHKYQINKAAPANEGSDKDDDRITISGSSDGDTSDSKEIPIDNNSLTASGLTLTGFPDESTISRPQTISRNEAINWVLHVLQRTRGRELPGCFNPMLISQLFWEQSEPWEARALSHINRIAQICQKFIELVSGYVFDVDVQARLFAMKTGAALKAAHSRALAELKNIINDKKCHPITYNHYFTTTIQKLRQKKYGDRLVNLSKNATVDVQEKTWTAGPGYHTAQYISSEKLQKAVNKVVEQDMDKFSADDALDIQAAYYKDELKYFIGVITKQVIERHLIDQLPVEIISPMITTRLTDDEVRCIAAEPSELTQRREALEARKRMLESGQETFRLAMVELR